MNEKEATKLEIKGRKIVAKKLQSVLNSLDKKIGTIEEERRKRKEEISFYKDLYELQEAYGFGCITEEEYDRLYDEITTGTEVIDEEVSPEEIAKDIIQEWLGRTKSDIASLKFDLLPPEKQAEIREKNEEILKRREERRARHDY